MTELSEIRSRLGLILSDPQGLRYDSQVLDEALRRALNEYSEAFPQEKRSLQTASGMRLQALAGLENLLGVRQVIYPCAGPASAPNFYSGGYALFWEGGAPYLEFLGSVPTAGEAYELQAAVLHSLQGLDGAEAGSVPPAHLDPLIYGAAGYAALTRAQALAETYGAKSDLCQKLEHWGAALTQTWLTFLERIGNAPASSPPFYSRARWALDTWDALQEEA